MPWKCPRIKWPSKHPTPRLKYFDPKMKNDGIHRFELLSLVASFSYRTVKLFTLQNFLLPNETSTLKHYCLRKLKTKTNSRKIMWNAGNASILGYLPVFNCGKTVNDHVTALVSGKFLANKLRFESSKPSLGLWTVRRPWYCSLIWSMATKLVKTQKLCELAVRNPALNCRKYTVLEMA